MKVVPVVTAAVVLIGLGAAWYLLGNEGAPPAAPAAVAPVERPAAGAPEPAEALPASDGATPDRLEAARPPPPPEPTVEAAIPASYRRALGALVGRVVEASGEPVPDLDLLLVGGDIQTFPPVDGLLRGESAELQLERGETRTDAEGRFRFGDLETRTVGAILIDPGGPRAHIHVVDQTPVSGEERDLGDIVLPGSVTVFGVVVDADSRPLPGVRVRVTDLPALAVGSGIADYAPGGGLVIDDDELFTVVPPASLSRWLRLLPIPTTRTDADGAFVLDGVRPGLVSIVCDDGVHQTLIDGPFPTGPAGGERDMGTLVLPDGLPVVGRVLDRDDEPVPGIEVRAGNQAAFVPMTVLRPPVVTDAEGRFQVTGLKDGAARVAARDGEGGGFVVSEVVSPGGAEVVLRLPGARRLLVTLHDGERTPIEDARFHARQIPVEGAADDMPDFLFPPRPVADVGRDEEGRYVLDGLGATLWDVIVHAPGFGIERHGIDLRESDVEVEWTLRRATGLDVVVTRASDGEPVEHAWVAVFGEDADDDGPPAPLTSARTGANGRAALGGLQAGSYAVEVSHPAWAVSRTLAEVPATEPLEIALVGGGAIAGTVLEGSEAPARILMVTMMHEDDPPLSAAMPRFTLTGPDGGFRFDRVQPGEVQLQLRERVRFGSLATWFEPFMETALAEDSVFVVDGHEVESTLVVGSTWSDIETGFVEGRLLVNGYPASGWKVTTWGRIRRSVTTAEDGAFVMGQLAAGEVVLLFSAAGSTFMGGAVQSHQLELAPGGHEFVEVSLATGGARGRVVSDLDGRPMEGVQVGLEPDDKGRFKWGFGGTATISGPDGTFEAPTLSEGVWRATAEAEGYSKGTSEPFEVRPMQVTEGIDVRLAPAVVVSGRVAIDAVLAEVDEPPRWIWLNAVTDEGGRASTRVDAEELTFAFDDMAPGTWRIELFTNLGTKTEAATLTVAGPASDVVLTFGPAANDEEDVEVVEDEETGSEG